MIKNMITPTTMFPCSTKEPKVSITCPAAPCSVRISLVEDMFSDNLNKVVINSNEGNMENSNASLMYIVVKRISKETVILMMNIISNKNGFNGTINKITTNRTNTDTTWSVIFLMYTINLFN